MLPYISLFKIFHNLALNHGSSQSECGMREAHLIRLVEHSLSAVLCNLPECIRLVLEVELPRLWAPQVIST